MIVAAQQNAVTELWCELCMNCGVNCA